MRSEAEAHRRDYLGSLVPDAKTQPLLHPAVVSSNNKHGQLVTACLRPVLMCLSGKMEPASHEAHKLPPFLPVESFLSCSDWIEG